MAILDPKMNSRFKGFSGAATKNSTTNIDCAIPDDYIISGAQMILKNHVWGDKINVQVVDKDNVLGFGADTVLSQYVSDWFIDNSIQSQGVVRSPDILSGGLPVNGLYIRFIYVSIGTALDVDVLINFYFYEDVQS